MRVDMLVTQSYLTLCDPMDCSPPGSSVHGILQARILEWVAMSSSGGSSQPGIKPRSPTLQADSLPSEPPGEHLNLLYSLTSFFKRHCPCHPVGKDERQRHKNNFCGHDEKYLNYSFPPKNPWSFLNHMKFRLKNLLFPLKQISRIICNTFSHVAASSPVNCILPASGAPSSLASWM